MTPTPHSIEQRDAQLIGTRASIRYHFHFDLAPQHLMRVVMEVDAVPATQSDITLVLPTWLPGSYKIREFSSNIGSVRATDRNGKPLHHEWTAKNRIRVTGIKRAFSLAYTYFAFERSVQQSHITRWHAFINPGNCCFFIEGRQHELHHVILHHPESTDWKSISTALSPVSRRGTTLGALNYDILVDSPLELGTHLTRSFTRHGARHDIAITGMVHIEADWVITQLKAIVDQGRKLFGSLPYDRYVFIIQLHPKSYGGLEHARSHIAHYDSDGLSEKGMPGKFLSLLTHEYFHTWNVKRIRPVGLGPFDYEREHYTTLLHFAEGATAYYDDLLSYRCGFLTESDYLNILSEQHLQALADVPGRLASSVKESSFLAWVKQYLPTADLNNRYVSYYLKGGVLWWLLDLHIIAKTNGRRRLDHGLRALMARYRRKPDLGVTEDELVSILSRACGINLRSTLLRWLNGTDELPTGPLLRKFGLELVKQKPGDEPTFGEKRASPAQPVDRFMGCLTKDNAGVFQVARVFPDSPAARAGLGAEDEIIAVNGIRVSSPKHWDAVVKSASLGDSIRVTASAEGRVYETTVSLLPSSKKHLVKMTRPSAAQKKLFAAWAKR